MSQMKYYDTASSTWKITDAGNALTLGPSKLSPNTTATASTIAARDASGNLTANQLISTVAQGTAPLTVTSTTVVPNLNASLANGYSFNQDVKTTASPTFAALTSSGALSVTGASTFSNTVTVSHNTNTPGLTLQGTSAGWASGIWLNNTTATTGKKYGVYTASDGKFVISDETAAATRFSIDTNGVVGSPKNILDNGSGNFGLGISPTFGFHQLGGSLKLQALVAPNQPTVTTVGTAGTTSYTYYIVAKDRTGQKTMPSPSKVIATGNAALSATNYNAISWTAVPGATSYDILKGDTSTLLMSTNGTSFNDIGGATYAYTAPSRNATADVFVDGTGRFNDALYSKNNTLDDGAAGDMTLRNGLNLNAANGAGFINWQDGSGLSAWSMAKMLNNELRIHSNDYTGSILKVGQGTLGPSVFSVQTDTGVVKSANNIFDDGVGKSTFISDMLINGAVNSLTLQGATTGWGSGLKLNNTTASTGRNYGIYSGSEGNFHFTDTTASIDRLTIFNGGKVTTTNNILDDAAGNLTTLGSISTAATAANSWSPLIKLIAKDGSNVDKVATIQADSAGKLMLNHDSPNSAVVITKNNILDAGDGTATFALGTATMNKAVSITGTTGLNLVAKSGAGSYNDLVAADDALIWFGSATSVSNALTIAPWSGTRAGLRLTGDGAVKSANTTLDNGTGGMSFGVNNQFINNIGYMVKSTNDFYIANHANTLGLIILSDAGDVTISGNIKGQKISASEGTGTNGGYSFYQDGAQDTGMFSPGDGDLRFYANAVDVMDISTTQVVFNRDINLRGTIMAPTRVTSGNFEFWDGSVWKGAGGVKSVQRGTTAFDSVGNPTTIAIASVNTAKTMVNLLATTIGDGGVRAIGIRLQDATTIAFVGTTAYLTLSWEVIEFY